MDLFFPLFMFCSLCAFMYYFALLFLLSITEFGTLCIFRILHIFHSLGHVDWLASPIRLSFGRWFDRRLTHRLNV